MEKKTLQDKYVFELNEIKKGLSNVLYDKQHKPELITEDSLKVIEEIHDKAVLLYGKGL